MLTLLEGVFCWIARYFIVSSIGFCWFSLDISIQLHSFHSFTLVLLWTALNPSFSLSFTLPLCPSETQPMYVHFAILERCDACYHFFGIKTRFFFPFIIIIYIVCLFFLSCYVFAVRTFISGLLRVWYCFCFRSFFVIFFILAIFPLYASFMILDWLWVNESCLVHWIMAGIFWSSTHKHTRTHARTQLVSTTASV